MAQPRKTSPGNAKRPARAESSASSSASTGRRAANPLDLVILTRSRVQELFDDAVDRGRMTRADATELAAELLRRGLKQTDELRTDVEQLLGRSRGGATDRVRREVDRARRAVGVGPSFPILGYDDLTAAQITDRLGDLTPAQLRKVRDYERRNANRKSVLGAIESKLR